MIARITVVTSAVWVCMCVGVVLPAEPVALAPNFAALRAYAGAHQHQGLALAISYALAVCTGTTSSAISQLGSLLGSRKLVPQALHATSV